jgi:hypothetical protein
MNAATIKVWWAIFALASGSGTGDYLTREGLPVFASQAQCEAGLRAYEAGLRAAYAHSIAPDFHMLPRVCKREERKS